MGPGIRQQLGRVILVAGVGIVNISNISVNSKAFVQNVVPGGTLGAGYKAVCTAGILTVTAISTAGVTVITDTSTLNYLLIG